MEAIYLYYFIINLNTYKASSVICLFLQGPPKGGKQGASGGGLFSKIGGFFSRKNEMKLPDDKEPSVSVRTYAQCKPVLGCFVFEHCLLN